MHSRAYLLLKRDLENLRRFPLEGISAEPCSELNMMEWEGKLCGLPDTPWGGGVFCLRMQFNGEFNSVPPTIQFMTVPFHPNIDPADGTPLCHLLSPTGWSEAVSLPVLLIALQALLSTPEPDFSVNPLATELLDRAPHTYRQMARDCVTASLRFDAGLPPYEEEEPQETVHRTPTPTPHLPTLHQSHPVSFDDYLSFWRDIATSKPPAPSPTDRGSTALSQRITVSAAGRRRAGSRRAGMEQKLRKHHILQHGQGGREGGRLSTSVLRQQRMDTLKLTYSDQKEKEEDDVDQLIHWTKELDGTQLSTPHSLTTPL